MYNKESCLNPVYSLRREPVWLRIYKGLKSIHKDYAGNIPEKNYSVINEVLRNSTAQTSGNGFRNWYKKRRSEAFWFDDNGKKCVTDAACKINLTPVHSRHYYKNIIAGQVKPKDKNTVIETKINGAVSDEINDINSCLVDFENNQYHHSAGSSYGIEQRSSDSGILFPDIGPGFNTISAMAYLALSQYRKNGVNDNTDKILDRILGGIPQVERDVAKKLMRLEGEL